MRITVNLHVGSIRAINWDGKMIFKDRMVRWTPKEAQLE